ncbi:MAG: diacylglycerol kinase family lipid kinase [Flavobacteriales bacterium]|nr:diacylglycerol kinase family lipid kinase [Flavobacteriales bacterium]
MQERWLFIVNPASGNGKGGIAWKPILQELQKAGMNPIVWSSEYNGHIQQLVDRAVHEGYRKIATYGGDGSLSAAVNGLMSQNVCEPSEVLLAHYPRGTGNDWCRFFKVPDSPVTWAAVIKKERQFRHDVGIIDLIKKGKPATHYFINVANVGYVAMCADLIENSQRSSSLLQGKLYYDYIAFKGLFSFNVAEMLLKYNEVERNMKLFNVAVAICKYNGGGMIPAPFADPADGILDVTLFEDMSKLNFLTDYPKLRKGTIFTNPKINGFRTEKLEITREDKPDLVEADGEFVGSTPATFSIKKQALRFVIGEVPEKKEFPY